MKTKGYTIPALGGREGILQFSIMVWERLPPTQKKGTPIYEVTNRNR